MSPLRSFSRCWCPTRKQAMVTQRQGSLLLCRGFRSTPSPSADGQRPPSDLDDDEEHYPLPVYKIRETEYPHMNKGTYLDHSGTTIYPQSLITAFSHRLSQNLYGNPHSANAPAELSGRDVDRIRHQALRFLGADPRHFDLVFVANATAAVKLVGDSFRDLAERTTAAAATRGGGSGGGGFWYGYHKDSHTSLVGVRELAGAGSHCFSGDGEVEEWLRRPEALSPSRGRPGQSAGLGLFAYPGQSNMTGRRLPLSWPARVRSGPAALRDTYTLLDCAALAMTSPLGGSVFRDVEAAPDFACVSFYKVFGFPDLGGLVVRRDSGHILALRRYFGGGTVTMVSVLGGAWHKTKGLDSTGAGGGSESGSENGGSYDIHDGLEDGTLPFHSIIALGEAMDVHGRVYGSMENVSRHTTRLSRRMYDGMRRLRHANGRPLCRIYAGDDDDDNGGQSGFGDAERQGAVVAFNLVDADGGYVPYSDVERIANDSGVYVRSGGICCPGGLFTALEYEPWQLQRAFSAHHVCGPDGINLIHQLPTGVVRASLGAMSTRGDVDTFVGFLRQTFIDQGYSRAVSPAEAGGSKEAASRQGNILYRDCGPVAAEEEAAA